MPYEVYEKLGLLIKTIRNGKSILNYFWGKKKWCALIEAKVVTIQTSTLHYF